MILEACRLGGFQACTSAGILREAEENIKESFPHSTFLRFLAILTEIAWDIGPLLPVTQIERYFNVVHPKDAHVIASAVAARAEFLLTLDKMHLLTDHLRNSDLPVIIVSPAEFIRGYYHLHEEYPSALPPRRVQP